MSIETVHSTLNLLNTPRSLTIQLCAMCVDETIIHPLCPPVMELKMFGLSTIRSIPMEGI